MISLSEAPFTPNVEPHELDPNYLITQIKFRLMSSGIMDDNHIKAYIYFYLFSHFVDKENAKNIDIPEDLLETRDSKRLRKIMTMNIFFLTLKRFSSQIYLNIRLKRMLIMILCVILKE